MNSNLNKAFRALRKAGYFARQNWACCQSCGWAEIPDGRGDKAVFYHAQDNDDKRAGKPFHMAWSGDGHEICRILNANGVKTSWNGSEGQRIMVEQW